MVSGIIQEKGTDFTAKSTTTDPCVVVRGSSSERAGAGSGGSMTQDSGQSSRESSHKPSSVMPVVSDSGLGSGLESNKHNHGISISSSSISAFPTPKHPATSILASGGSPALAGHNHVQDGASTSSHPVSDMESADERKTLHILLAVTGSVATIKIANIIGKLKQIYREKAEIQLIVTRAAEHFMQGIKIPSGVKVWRDTDEWTSRRGRAESMVHVKLRRWADILLIAPLSANSLSKIANGICDNLLTSVIRSWNPATPILVAPAMNTYMYTNPITKKHLAMLKEDCKWIEVLRPVEKVLVCGDIGMGGMREWADIVQVLASRLGGYDDEEDDDDDEDEDDRDVDEDDNDDEDDDDDDEDNPKNSVVEESSITAGSLQSYS